MKTVLIVLGVVVLAIAVLTGPRTYTLATEPDYYPWPSVTRCRMCDERIYTWQDHERRTYYSTCENGVCFSKSGLVHTDCEHNPDADFR